MVAKTLEAVMAADYGPLRRRVRTTGGAASPGPPDASPLFTGTKSDREESHGTDEDARGEQPALLGWWDVRLQPMGQATPENRSRAE